MDVIKFSDLIGNEGSILLLKRSLARKTLKNFVIMEGVNGTGKSTSATITAMSLLCENPQDGEPCLCCSSCRAIMDMPAGSSHTRNFNRVNIPAKTAEKDFDSLLNEIFILQNTTSNSVYVLEEAHAIKDEASQEKLLDRIDHMPSNVYIIMTTTEANRLIDPLRSRALEFQFSRLNKTSSMLLLDRTCIRLGITFTKEHKELIIREGRGIPRDLVKLTEFVAENNVTLEELRAFLGDTITTSDFIDLFTSLTEVNSFHALSTLGDLLSTCDTATFTRQLKSFILNAIFLVDGGIKENFSRADCAVISETFSSKQLLQIASLLERVNGRTSEEDLKFIFIKIRTIMQNTTQTSLLSRNVANAKQQNMVATSLKQDKVAINREQGNSISNSEKISKDAFASQVNGLMGMEVF